MEERYSEQIGRGSHYDAGDDDIDLTEIARKLWAGRKLILKWCCAAAVAGLIVGFSIPREYTASAVLSPEANGVQGMSGSIGQLAGMMGFNVGSSSKDAVYPMLYPDVVTSVPFITDLFTLEVADRKGKMQTTLYDYMENRQRSPWWSVVLSAPAEAAGWLISRLRGTPNDADPADIDTFCLTRDQMRVMKALGKRIGVAVDKKTMVVTLTVTMQDPLIAAVVAEAVIENLKGYITEYRTSKARNDLAFMEQLFAETKANYERAQSRYAEYVDRNQNIALQRVRIEQERLQNEMNMRFNVYNQTAQQLQVAKAKVQESTPVYAVVKPVTVPLSKSKPSRMVIMFGFIFLAGVVSSAWVLFGREAVEKIRSGNAECK